MRQAPLTAEEVERTVKARSARIEACYRSEAANSRELAAFVFKLEIPPDGSPPAVLVLKKSGPEQRVLEACLIDTLRALRFPRHTGGAVVIELPVQYSGTISSAGLGLPPGAPMLADRGAGDLR